MTAKQRCNKPAAWYSPTNGFRACREHGDFKDGLLACSEAGPAPFGPCDEPVETMSAKHTAGPWTVGQGFSFDNRECVMVRYQNEHPIANCGYTSQTAEANARLIAAAPELLEACYEMIRDMEAPRSQVATRAWDKARAAIAKAYGR